jgi:hypothetical protein
MFAVFAAVGLFISVFIRPQVLGQTRKSVALGLETEEAKYATKKERLGRRKGIKGTEV